MIKALSAIAISALIAAALLAWRQKRNRSELIKELIKFVQTAADQFVMLRPYPNAEVAQ